MSCRWKKRESELRLVRTRYRRSSAAVSSNVRSRLLSRQLHHTLRPLLQ
jgi:hypothetical protein